MVERYYSVEHEVSFFVGFKVFEILSNKTLKYIEKYKINHCCTY